MKPENILFESKSKDAQIRLIDFGLAKYYKKSSVTNSVAAARFSATANKDLGDGKKKC